MRIVIPNYTFDASAKTVTFTDYSTVSLEGVLLITNVTDNIIIYNFADANKGGSAATNVLTLDFDTTSMSDTDDIQILYDDTGSVEADNADNVAVSARPNKLVVVNRNMMFDGSTWDRVRGTSADGLLVNLGTNNDVTVTGTVDLGATDNAVLDAIAASVAAIDTDTTTIIGHVDGIEGLLTTIDADTSGIITAVQLIDDTVVVLGTDTYTEATSKGLVFGAVRRDADTTLVNTTNEFGPLQMDANGRLKVEIFDGGDSHTVDNNGTFAVQATLQTGDNTVGRVKITDGTDVADVLDLANSNPIVVAIVDASGDQITSFGGGTEYTEDAAAAANPVGKATILVRADTPAGIATTNGDNVAQRGTNYGAAFVQLVTSSGAFIDSIGGGEEHATNEAYVDGDLGKVALTVRDDALSTLTEADGDYSTLRVDSTGALWVRHSGNITADLGATDNAVLDAIAASVAAIDTDTTTIIGHVDGIEGLLTTIDADTGSILTSVQLIDDTIFTAGTDTYTEATSKGQLMLGVRRDADTTLANTTNEFVPFQVDANGYLKVEIFDGGGSHTVDNNGTFVTQENGAALTALQIMDDWDNTNSDGASVTGDVAHDGIDAGEPVKIGFKAIAHGSNPSAVAANDRTDAYANRHGIQFVIGGHPNTQLIQANYTDADGAQTNAAIIAVSAGTKIVVTHITVTADNANTGDVQCRIGFGTANTPGNDAAKVLLSHPGIAPGSGISIGNGGGILGVGADDEDLRITCEDPAGGSLDVVVGYYTIES